MREGERMSGKRVEWVPEPPEGANLDFIGVGGGIWVEGVKMEIWGKIRGFRGCFDR